MSVEKENMESEDESKTSGREQDIKEEAEPEKEGSGQIGLGEEVDEKYRELENRYLRLQADFANYKKRNEKEREGLVKLGVESLAVELLPVIDNFERAMVMEEVQDEGFYQGIELIRKQLIEVLEKQGIEEIEAANQSFDPDYHYAVQMVDSKDHRSNTVIEVIQKGYILKDKVIRPAMVIVSN